MLILSFDKILKKRKVGLFYKIGGVKWTTKEEAED